MECERERKRELGKSGREGEGRRRREGKKLFPENPSERAHQKHRADAERTVPPSWRTLEGALLIALSAARGETK